MRRAIVGVLAVAALLVVLAVLVAGSAPAGSSTWSPRGDGLLAAYRYLEERGHDVARWQRPAEDLPLDPSLTLVVAAPWSEPWSGSALAHVENLLRRGGRVVYLTSGERPGIAELTWDAHFETWPSSSGERPPLSYTDWRRWVRTPVIARARRPALRRHLPPRLAVRRGGYSPLIGGGAERLYVGPAGGTRVARRPVGRGELIVIDNAGVFSNALISEPGNLELLEWIAARPGGRLLFDEFIHGHRDAGVGGNPGSASMLGLALQLLALYAALVWALAVRFGRPLPDEGPPRSSVARDLEALAALHRAAGHAPEAGLALEEAVRTLSGPAGGTDPEDRPTIRNERQLLERARAIGRRQLEGRL